MSYARQFFRVILVVLTILKTTSAICDTCQDGNMVACHSENVFSLCVDGAPTLDNITCPENYQCTDGFYVCYPKDEIVASCTRTEQALEDNDNSNLCGVCRSPQKDFACVDETTIAFCYGEETPYYDTLTLCPENTVCDLKSTTGFCSDKVSTVPSCTSPSTTPTTSTPTSTKPTTTTPTTTTPTTTTPTNTTPTTTTPTTTTPTTTTPTTATPTTTTPTSTTPTTTTPTTTTPTITTITTTTLTTTTPTTTTPTTTTPTTTTPTTITPTPTTPTTTTPTTTTPATTTPTTTTSTTTTPITTTPIATTPSTTTLSPQKFCQDAGSIGFYKNDADPTCKSYFYCYSQNNIVWSRTDYECDEGYFDETLKNCVNSKPDGCI